MGIRPRLEKAFKRGLAQAALATNAWIITGGTDSGVMSLVGRSLAEYNCTSVQCIGIVPWGVIFNRAQMEGAQGSTIDLVAEREADATGANLEPHHSIFLMPDTGKTGGAAFGAEIVFRARLEAEYCRRGVPRVLVVVQGGPGTLSTVLECLTEGCPVVLIADSGGVAELIDLFVREYKDSSSKYYMQGHIPQRPEFARFHNPGALDKLGQIAKIDWEQDKIHSFRLSETSTSELDVHLLNAVINDRDQCKQELRLKLAVEWKRMDVVKQVRATHTHTHTHTHTRTRTHTRTHTHMPVPVHPRPPGWTPLWLRRRASRSRAGCSRLDALWLATRLATHDWS
jgi:hypothetical protein